MVKNERNKLLNEKLSEVNPFISMTYERDFTTWDDFGMLWNYSTKQKWWNDFLIYSKVAYEDNEQSERFIRYTSGIIKIVNPDLFADKLYDFLKDIKK